MAICLAGAQRRAMKLAYTDFMLQYRRIWEVRKRTKAPLKAVRSQVSGLTNSLPLSPPPYSRFWCRAGGTAASGSSFATRPGTNRKAAWIPDRTTRTSDLGKRDRPHQTFLREHKSEVSVGIYQLVVFRAIGPSARPRLHRRQGLGKRSGTSCTTRIPREDGRVTPLNRKTMSVCHCSASDSSGRGLCKIIQGSRRRITKCFQADSIPEDCWERRLKPRIEALIGLNMHGDNAGGVLG